MNQMQAMADAENRAVTKAWSIAQVARVEHRKQNEETKAALRSAVRAVSEVWGIPVDVVMGRSRKPDVVRARHLAMFACLQAGYSSPQVGRFFNRDHTTVLHAKRRVMAARSKGAGQ